MVTPMVCLLVVEANNTTRRVTCLAHPFPSSPAWYWVQREISLPEEGIETTHVKLKIVLTVDDTSTGAAGVAYFDDITASFSGRLLTEAIKIALTTVPPSTLGSPPQLLISFTVSLCSAMVLVFCFVVCQLCSVRFVDLGVNLYLRMYASTDRGVYASTDRGMYASTDRGMYASTDRGMYASTDRGMYASTDGCMCVSITGSSLHTAIENLASLRKQ